MKIEERTEEKVIKESFKVYIANDGTEFSTEKACREYDNGAECAYRTLLSKVMKPLMGSFKYSDIENNPELVNVYKNIIDDIFEDGRRECEYYTFKPQSEEDIKNFLALLKVQNASLRGERYKIKNPFTQLKEIKNNCNYIIIFYEGGTSYQIIEALQFSEVIKEIIEKALDNELIK